jgi:hypothetical protein
MPQFSNADIRRLVSELPKGEINAINAPDLANRLGYSSAPNQETLRALIRQAINQGELIGSSHSGYWILDSKVEVEEVLDSLEQRSQGVCDRRNSLLDSWNTNNPKNVSSYSHVDVKP